LGFKVTRSSILKSCRNADKARVGTVTMDSKKSWSGEAVSQTQELVCGCKKNSRNSHAPFRSDDEWKSSFIPGKLLRVATSPIQSPTVLIPISSTRETNIYMDWDADCTTKDILSIWGTVDEFVCASLNSDQAFNPVTLKLGGLSSSRGGDVEKYLISKFDHINIRIGERIMSTRSIIDFSRNDDCLNVIVSCTFPLGTIFLRNAPSHSSSEIDQWLTQLRHLPLSSLFPAQIDAPVIEFDALIDRKGTTAKLCKYAYSDLTVLEALVNGLLPELFSLGSCQDIWLGVEKNTRMDFGVLYSGDCDIFVSAIKLFLSGLFPPVGPTFRATVCVRNVEIDVDSFECPMMLQVDEASAVAMLECLGDCIAVSPTSDENRFAVVIEAERLTEVLSIIRSGESDTSWGRGLLKRVALSMNKKWISRLHKFQPAKDWIRDEMVVDPNIQFSRCVARIRLYNDSTTHHHYTLAEPNVASIMMPDGSTQYLSAFQMWLRCRGVRGGAVRSGLHYALQLDNSCCRVLYCGEGDNRELLERALGEYCADSAYTIDVMAESPDSFRDIIADCSWFRLCNVVVIGSFEGLKGACRRLATPHSDYAIRCVVFCSLHEVRYVKDLCLGIPSPFQIVDVALFPIQSLDTGPCGDLAEATYPFLTPVPFHWECPVSSDDTLRSDAVDWIQQRKYKMAPWSLINRNWVFQTKNIRVLFDLIVTSRGQNNKSVSVQKVLPVSGVTATLQGVAWKLQHELPGARCYFLNAESRGVAAAEALQALLDQARRDRCVPACTPGRMSAPAASHEAVSTISTDDSVTLSGTCTWTGLTADAPSASTKMCNWIVLFIDDHVNAGELTKLCEECVSMWITLVEVTVKKLSGSHHSQDVLGISIDPYLDDDEILRLSEVLVQIGPPSCRQTLTNLRTCYIREREASSHAILVL
jgi:hypothetical protein